MRPEDVARAVALCEEGRSVRYIANVLGTAKSTVNDAIRRFYQTGQYTRRAGSGRPRITTHREDRFLRLSVLRDRRLPSTLLARRFANVRGHEISALTVRRRLQEYQMRSRKPALCPDLSRNHRVERLQFAREHAEWTVEQWSAILFTDESRFNVRSSDGREKVWRRRGERFAECCISPRIPFGGGGVMVWAGISMYAKTELVILDHGTMTADRYVNQCLADHVIPFAPFIGDNFVLMHDNARPHVAAVVTEYLNEVGINRFRWPARSPDLNPIEHLWDSLGRRVRNRHPTPESVQELRVALVEEWDQIDHREVAVLIESMPRRMAEVIRARGGNTRY